MKKSLSQAIALAALVGGAATAQAAIEVNPNGIGGALLYPIYSVNNGNSTLVSVVNTTDEFKAVKVRFVEGKNSAEVLDFHLYMSPKDVWSGTIVATETGAKLVSNDKSCIAGVTDNKGNFPAAGLPFNAAQIVKDGDDVAVTGPHADRVRVGHFEVLEMAEVDNAELQKAIKHVDGVPGGCDLIAKAWAGEKVFADANPSDPKIALWKMAGEDVNDRTNNAAGLSVPKGGLYGTGAVINVTGGWSASYDAVALGDAEKEGFPFYAKVQHPRPGSIYPNLTTVITDVAGSDEVTPNDSQLDAVTDALELKAIYNDYFVDSAYGAETDLVVTFPTKRFYTFEATDLDTTERTYIYGGNVTDNPFGTTVWSGQNTVDAGVVTKKGTGTAPVVFDFPTAYDKDEQANTATAEDLWVSPRPLEKPEGLPLNYETNVISVNDSDTFGTDGLLRVELDVPFLEGWVEIEREKGIPAIGFANIVTKNGAEADGVLRNFAQTFKHKTVK